MTRKTDILGFIKDNQLCSLDSIFTNGNIPKSKKTIDLVQTLVDEKKINEISNEKGKKRYYTKLAEISPERIFELLRLMGEQSTYLLKITRMPDDIIEGFRILLKYRIQILQKEAENSNSKISLDSGLQVMKRAEFVAKNPQTSLDKIRKWLDEQIERDRYYLTHQLRGLSVKSQIHDPEERERTSIVPTWKPRNRMFQPIKESRKIRSVSDKLGISKDRHEYGLSRPNQLYHAETLKTKNTDPTEKHTELFKRLAAEYGRNLIKNPDTVFNERLIVVLKERLEIIRKDHSQSKNYLAESNNLKEAIRILEENPTWLVDEWNKKEKEWS